MTAIITTSQLLERIDGVPTPVFLTGRTPQADGRPQRATTSYLGTARIVRWTDGTGARHTAVRFNRPVCRLGQQAPWRVITRH